MRVRRVYEMRNNAEKVEIILTVGSGINADHKKDDTRLRVPAQRDGTVNRPHAVGNIGRMSERPHD